MGQTEITIKNAFQEAKKNLWLSICHESGFTPHLKSMRLMQFGFLL